MNTQLDASIPVLTEIIEVATPLTALSSTAASPSDAATSTGLQPDSEQWLLLEQTLKENVLKQILARVDFVLEHRVRDNLADILQTAVEGLATEIRSGLKNSLEDIVTRAVNQEITKAKIPK